MGREQKNTMRDPSEVILGLIRLTLSDLLTDADCKSPPLKDVLTPEVEQALQRQINGLINRGRNEALKIAHRNSIKTIIAICMQQPNHQVEITHLSMASVGPGYQLLRMEDDARRVVIFKAVPPGQDQPYAWPELAAAPQDPKCFPLPS